MQHLLWEHLSSGTRCVIHTSPRATGEGCRHEVGIARWYFTLTNKTRETIAGMGCPVDSWKNWFGSTAIGSCSCRREVKTEKCSHKIPVSHWHLRQSSSIFHKNNNKWFLHYFAISCCTEQAPPPRSESSRKRWQAWFLCFVLQTSERTCRAIIRPGSHQQAFHLLKPHIDTCLFIATALHHSFKHISICE